MTREQKIAKRKLRAYNRKAKRIAKDKKFLGIAYLNDEIRISWGRKKSQGKIWTCEMGYGDCESRGYCNGDC
jgi:hypothetical protein